MVKAKDYALWVEQVIGFQNVVKLLDSCQSLSIKVDGMRCTSVSLMHTKIVLTFKCKTITVLKIKLLKIHFQ